MADLPITSNDGGQPILINDPTTTANVANVKGASTAAVAADNALVVSLSPNSPTPTDADKSTSGTMGALNATIALTTNGIGSLTFLLSGVWVATVVAEGTTEGATWTNIPILPLGGGGLITSAGVSANGAYRVTVTAAQQQIRLRVSAYTSGTVTANINAAQPTSPFNVYQTNPANLNAQVAGDIASGTADSGNPVKQGFVGVTALPTAVTTGQRANAISDKFGRQATVLGTVRDLKGTQTTTISASVAETTIVTAGGAGIFNDPFQILVANTSAATSTRIDFRDATAGAVRFSLQCPANQTTGFNLPGESIPQTTAANNWTAQCATSTTDIRIYILFEKNQ